MIKAADVVTVDFAGATGRKRRPAVVLSSDTYHRERPDVILGVLTSNIGSATAATDYILLDWNTAGLRVPTAFGVYLGMALPTAIRKIGSLSPRDWAAIRERVQRAFG